MPFCQNCGQQLAAEDKFCASCGRPISWSAPSTQTAQPHFMAPKLVGIFKELEADEKIVYQGVIQTEVMFVKEAFIKKVIGQERKEVPISISNSMIYLTNQRLIFLKLFEVSASELGRESNLLAGAAGSFYEVPVSAVMGVDMRPVKLNKNDEQRFIELFGEGGESMLKRPALEIIYDEKAATGRAKDYMESMLKRGMLSKLWGKVEHVSDKIFVLGESSVALQPYLSSHMRRRAY